MAMQFSVNLSFPGNAAAAFRHYQQIFGGELELPFSPRAAAGAHATLTCGTVRFAGGFATEQDAPGLGSDVYSLLLQFDSVGEAEDVVEKFLAGGAEAVMPFEPAPWGDHHGQVRDRFGVLWMFNATEG